MTRADQWSYCPHLPDVNTPASNISGYQNLLVAFLEASQSKLSAQTGNNLVHDSFSRIPPVADLCSWFLPPCNVAAMYCSQTSCVTNCATRIVIIHSPPSSPMSGPAHQLPAARTSQVQSSAYTPHTQHTSNLFLVDKDDDGWIQSFL